LLELACDFVMNAAPTPRVTSAPPSFLIEKLKRTSIVHRRSRHGADQQRFDYAVKRTVPKPKPYDKLSTEPATFPRFRLHGPLSREHPEDVTAHFS